LPVKAPLSGQPPRHQSGISCIVTANVYVIIAFHSVPTAAVFYHEIAIKAAVR
jgi:hypothetical protein